LARQEARWENYRTDDAEFVLVGYGIVSRILKRAVDELRREGIPAGMLRPITLFPFPVEECKRLASRISEFVVVEMSTGQMVEDVRLAVEGATRVSFYGRGGGNLPGTDEIKALVEGRVRKEGLVYA